MISAHDGERMNPGRRRMGLVLVLLAVLVMVFYAVSKHEPSRILPPAGQSASSAVKAHLESERECPLSPHFVPGVVSNGNSQGVEHK